MAHSSACMPPFRTLLTCAPLLNPAAVRSLQCIAQTRSVLNLALLQTSFCTRLIHSSTAYSQTEASSLASSAPQAATAPAFQGDGKADQLVKAAQRPPLAPGLYLVGTPIGNLEDITLRALRVLRDCHAILAEDTRHSSKLLQSYGITTRLHSFHAHNERAKEDQVLQLLGSGQAVALISDAGMPLISDPGASLVHRVTQQGVAVYPIPGPSAPLAALVASGLATERFQFCGFLPPKQGARMEAIKLLKGYSETLLFFAPPHSLVQILADLVEILGSSRPCVIARELTKMHEEFFRGTLSEANSEFSHRTPKGEITLVVAGEAGNGRGTGEGASPADVEERLIELLCAGCSPSSAAKLLSKQLKLSKNFVYGIANGLSLCARCKNRRHPWIGTEEESAQQNWAGEQLSSSNEYCPVCAGKTHKRRGC